MDKHKSEKEPESIGHTQSGNEKKRKTKTATTVTKPGKKASRVNSTASSGKRESKSSTNNKRVEEQGIETRPFMIIGIGASAGGLEAFKELLEHLPTDTGMAFVLVQHLDPTHESILTEILTRVTKMRVSEVAEGMRVEPNRVYVIPSNTNMAISGGVLKLLPREENRIQHRPIDHFFRSLAEDQGNCAIGVVLSGTASDGTQGLEAIKAEGGITFAQDIRSAKYDSMSRSAIASGCVDFILTPEAIAKELAWISSHPYVAITKSVASTEAVDQPEAKNGFGKILMLLRKSTDVDFSLYKPNTLHRRIMRRVILNKLGELDDYATYLRENPDEVKNLYQDILINVTCFFRQPETFEVLKDRIFPQIIENRSPDEPIRIWVLGCSTGEEAYSIAMSFIEFAGERADHIPFQVFATDLNDRGIETARSGLYSKNIVEDVSAERLRRFFTESDGGYRISKPIRDMCVFARQNVITDPPFSRINLISCRNLLIYLEPVLQKRILPLLHYALKPKGFLWLGSSETVGASADLFIAEDKKHRFYMKKAVSSRLSFDFVPGDSLRGKELPEQRKVSRPGAAQMNGEQAAQREAERIIFSRYAPANVLINEEMEVLHFRGNTSPYLEQPPGKATLNLLKLTREGLLVALRAAIHKARKDNRPVRKEHLRVKYNGQQSEVGLEVIPLKLPASSGSYFLILFEAAAGREVQESNQARPVNNRKRRSQREAETGHVNELKQELAATREYLQSVVEQYEATNEELQSANEEAQSANEEFQSINEELETAKEELESSNEELTTLNDELQNRNAELGRSNSDLINLLGSVQMPILMLDSNLRIRRFTPSAEKALNLILTDVGRPIADIKTNIDFPELEQMIKEVIDTVSVKEREVQDMRGRWYMLRIWPYKTLENKIDGAVLVIVDIDALKQIETQSVVARTTAEEANRIKDEFLATVSHELRTPLNSIIGWTEMLSSGRLDEDATVRAIASIARSAKAQAEIIKDLLDVSRIIAGKMLLKMQTVELLQVIETALDIVRPTADAKGIKLKSKLDPATGPVYGDADRLQQIVWNLLANAVKFTPAGGRVEVRLEREGTHIAITVEDTGVGISPEFLPHIFDRFRQADSSSTRSYGGLGLGLAIVRNLVESHGGTVSAESQGKGRGVTLKVMLPPMSVSVKADGKAASLASGADAMSLAPLGSTPSLKALRVIIVDDERDAREMLGMALTYDGAEVRDCASAREALEMLDRWQPDVIVSDIGMPGEDGYELMRKVRELSPERGGRIPAIALTGYARAEDEKRVLAAGYQMHLAKPVSLDDLAAAIKCLGRGIGMK